VSVQNKCAGCGCNQQAPSRPLPATNTAVLLCCAMLCRDVLCCILRRDATPPPQHLPRTRTLRLLSILAVVGLK
jgi:hypothetical protein